MNPSSVNRKGKTGATAAIVGALAIVAACIPCCMTLAAPILAWLGLATLGGAATGWYLFAAAVFAIGVATVLFLRRRRVASCNASQRAGDCGCGNSCKL